MITALGWIVHHPASMKGGPNALPILHPDNNPHPNPNSNLNPAAVVLLQGQEPPLQDKKFNVLGWKLKSGKFQIDEK